MQLLSSNFGLLHVNPFAPCDTLDGPQQRTTLEQEYLENGTARINTTIKYAFVKVYSISLLIIPRLIGLAIVVLYLLMFKVKENLGTEFFKFF